MLVNFLIWISHIIIKMFFRLPTFFTLTPSNHGKVTFLSVQYCSKLQIMIIFRITVHTYWKLSIIRKFTRVVSNNNSYKNIIIEIGKNKNWIFLKCHLIKLTITWQEEKCFLTSSRKKKEKNHQERIHRKGALEKKKQQNIMEGNTLRVHSLLNIQVGT